MEERGIPPERDGLAPPGLFTEVVETFKPFDIRFEVSVLAPEPSLVLELMLLGGLLTLAEIMLDLGLEAVLPTAVLVTEADLVDMGLA